MDVVEDAVRGSQLESPVDSWAWRALQTSMQRPGVHRVGLAVPEGGGRRLRFTASDREVERSVPWCHIDAYDDLPLNTAVREGRAVMGTLEELTHRYASFAERQQDSPTTAVAAVPMVAAGQVAGAFILFYDRLEAFLDEDPGALAAEAARLGSELRDVRRHTAPPPEDTSVPPGAQAATHRVAATPAAVGGARRFLRATLAEWGVHEDIADTAVLCLSELVTNAVIHTDGGCLVRVTLDHGVLTTTVRDSGDGPGTAPPAADPLQVHGRGLRVVDALATRWGSEAHADGTSVWFVLDLEH